MSSKTTSWILQLVDKISAPLKTVQTEADGTAGSMAAATTKAAGFGDCLRKLKPMDWQATKMGLQTLDGWFEKVNEQGASYDAALREVSAITDVTGDALDDLGSQARGLSKDFGSSATDNLKTFQTILSRLGPQIGSNAAALGDMGKYANTLSKTMGGDVAGATDALTTSLLQFRVNLDDPVAAAGEMERMMNVMAAGAKEGAAEVLQVGDALKQAGVAAKLAGVSFEEANAAVQAMADGGKYGSEAGVAIRNVITNMSATSKLTADAVGALDVYGIKLSDISDASVPFAGRLKKLAPIQNDINALTLMFGRENAAAAQILISSADSQADLTEKITGTNTAYAQAETIMGGWTEKLSRARAWVDNLKIGCFDFTSVVGLMVGGITGSLAALADFSTIYSGLVPVIKSAGMMVKNWTVWSKIATVATATWTGVQWLLGTACSALAAVMNSTGAAIKGWTVWSKIATVATTVWTGVQWALNAAFLANPIGWIVLGIGALIGAVALCWNKFEGFRAAVTGVWEVIKGFGNIIKNFVIDRIKGLLSGIGAIGQAIVKLFKGDFKGAWESTKEGISGIVGVDAVKNAYNSGKGLGEAYSKGAEAGRAAFRAKKAKKEGESSEAGLTGASVKGGFTGAWKPSEEEQKSGMYTEGLTGAPANGGFMRVRKPAGEEQKKGAATDRNSKDVSVNVSLEKEVNVGAKSVIGREQMPAVKPLSQLRTDSGKNAISELSGGTGSGKSVTMNVTLNITNNGVKNPDEFTEQIVRKLNDRLSDSLAATG